VGNHDNDNEHRCCAVKDKSKWVPALRKLFSNREIMAYLIVGGCTALVSFGTYWLYTRAFSISNEHLAKFLSMLTAMIFSYYPNKVWVFRSRYLQGRGLLREIITFFATRGFSAFIVEQGLFALFIEILRMSDLPANIIVMTIIVVLNYVVAKFYVFRRRKNHAHDSYNPSV